MSNLWGYTMPQPHEQPAREAASNSAPCEVITLQNQTGLSCRLRKTADGWGFGPLALHGNVVEPSAMDGLLCLRNLASGEVRWLAGTVAERIAARTLRLRGDARVDDATFTFSIDVEVDDVLAVIRMTPAWSVDTDLTGWEVVLAYHHGFSHDWRVQGYPWAGNSGKWPFRRCAIVACPACWSTRRICRWSSCLPLTAPWIT